MENHQEQLRAHTVGSFISQPRVSERCNRVKENFKTRQALFCVFPNWSLCVNAIQRRSTVVVEGDIANQFAKRLHLRCQAVARKKTQVDQGQQKSKKIPKKMREKHRP